MASERTYPCLPCRDIDEAIAFYEVLGFRRTYRQVNPNPYAVVEREDFHVHLFGMPDFDPANSYGCAIVTVPDPDQLYHAFAKGLRGAFKKLPVAGIPRILRPRKKFGTVYSFSVVDPGGNWLRISRTGDSEEGARKPGLPGILDVAARLGDAHGDDALALKTLEGGLKKYPHAPAIDQARAFLYRAELAARLKKKQLAHASLAAAKAAGLSPEEEQLLADDFAQATALVMEL